MSQDPRHVPHKMHSALELAVTLLDLPLTAAHLEALALELTGPVRALIAEALAAVGDDAPVVYAVAAGTAEVEESEFAGCLQRVGLDVDLDSPAATLADRLRSTQHDVVSTEVPASTTLGITVRPGSLACWRWWLGTLGVTPSNVTVEGKSAVGTGSCKGVTVHLRGEGVPDLLTDHAAARLMGVLVQPVAP
ncbi:hypothetical protein [Streptomyces sp. NPDC010273]|uniref:hypothetical protein n=1 Tax=Streptomyces sp. NPDC010273 TaxID=3364829 RepID=UPI0036EC97D8